MSAPVASVSPAPPTTRPGGVTVPYAAFGAATATWQVLLAELVVSLDVGPALLGLALTAGGLASLPPMLVAGRRIDRHGAGAPLAGGAALATAGLVGLALAPGPAAFVGATVAFLLGFGLVDVAINARAVHLEQGGRRSVVAAAYVGFSAGALAATVVVGLALAAGAPFRGLMALGALPLAAVAMTARGGAQAPAHRVTPASPATAPAAHRGVGVLLALLAGVVALAFVIQGTLEQWTTIYLRTDLGVAAGASGTGLAAFHLAMLGGRVVGLRSGAAVEREALLRGAGLVVAAGMAVALATTLLPLVLLGILTCGLACGLLVPAATSLAGDAAGRRSGTAAATLATAGYGTSLLAPAVVGGVADAIDLRAALGVLVVAGLGASACGTAVLRAAGRRSG